MRILIMTFGSRGDVQPFVALGQALKARGHAVTLSAGAGFEAMIEAAGLNPAPLSVDVRAMIASPEIQEALRTFSGKIKAWRNSQDMLRQQVDDTATIIREHEADLLVYHPKAFPAVGMAAARGTPSVPTFLQPGYVATSTFPTIFMPVGNLGRIGNRASHALMLGLIRLGFAAVARKARKRAGTPKTTRWPQALEGFDPRGGAVPKLHAHSRHLAPKPPDWGPQDHVTGYWFTDPDPDWAPPDDLARFLASGPPPVYVGFGSMPAKDADRLTAAVVGAIHQANARGILATGWGGLASDLAATPASDRILMLEAAPHDWLFPRCAAIVHHGGAGTTHEALRWGRPSILCPVFGDQPFWARRVADLGASPKPIPQKRLTADALANAIAQTSEQAMIDRATALGRAIQAEQGAQTAAGIIDDFLAARTERAA
ncbi:MAG: glycosyltransferase [Pseudomonadota bacterium]